MLNIDFTKRPDLSQFLPTLTIIAHNPRMGVRDIDTSKIELQPLDKVWFAGAFENPGEYVENNRTGLLNANLIVALRQNLSEVPEILKSTRKKLLVPGTLFLNKYQRPFLSCFVHGHSWTALWQDEDPDDIRVLSLRH